MAEYMVIFALFPLAGLIVGKQAYDNKRSFWLWWFYGTLFTAIALIHLHLISEDPQDDDDENELIESSEIVKHDKNCTCLECILEQKRLLTHTDWPESYDDDKRYNKSD